MDVYKVWYLLTDSDLDTGLVELDGGRPGDEAGTEKKDLVDHDCGLLSEWVLIDRRSERSHVKCKFTTSLPQWLIKVYPGPPRAGQQTTPTKEKRHAAMSEFKCFVRCESRSLPSLRHY